MSRKIVKKALPPAWNIDLSEAADGEQAIKAYREGKAHIMFLDLTMPVKDGFQVLEAIQADGMKSFVVVISADIQPKAQQRVKELGAMAFIKKPVKPEDIANILKEYGIFG
jgi:CheY-like chemotaxis protein